MNIFNWFLKMEAVYLTYFEKIKDIENLNINDFFVQILTPLPVDIPDCHNLKLKIIKTYCRVRANIKSRFKASHVKFKTTNLSSKSQAMHLNVK